MSLSDKANDYNGNPGRNPKPLKPKSKLDRLFKTNLVKITDKSVMLTKIKNSPGIPTKGYAYKVQKLNNYGRKPNSPRNSKKRNAKESKDKFDYDDLPTSGNDDEDLTPRNKDKQLATQKSNEDTTPNDNVDNDIEGRDDFLCVWQEQDTLSVNSELTDSDQSLSEYLYFENQTTVELSLNWNKLNEEQNTELIRFGNKTFRSQQTSTNDLFKLRKLSVFASSVLQKCLELEQMKFNISGSSSLGIIRLNQPRLPTIPEENASEDAQMSPDTVYKDEGKPRPDCCPHLRQAKSNLLTYFIVAIIGLLVLIVGLVYIRFYLDTPEPPKPLWQRYFRNLMHFLCLYD